MRHTTAVCSIVLILATAGCGGSKKTIHGADGSKTEVTTSGSGDKVKITTKEGTAEVSTGGDLSLPADFPTDVPLPKGGKLIQSGSFDKSKHVGYEVGEPPTALHPYFQEQLKKQGWTIQSENISADGGLILAEKADRNVMIATGKGDPKGTVVITVTQKDKPKSE